MKSRKFISNVFVIVVLLFADGANAQTNCLFKEPIFKIDFGTVDDRPAVNVFPLLNYKEVNRTCPDDGYYSFVSYTSDCFNGDWLTFNEDYTSGDNDGRMMLVNASPEGGVFFNTVITDLHESTTYQLSASMVNVCRISGGCAPLPPNITMKFLTPAGRTIVSFQTGLLSQNANPRWRVYSGLFTTPPNTTTLILTMEDITLGGCGNDFALDDITVRECIKPIPVTKQEVKPQLKPAIQSAEPVPGSANPIVKKVPAIKSEVKKAPVKSPGLKSVDATTIQKQPVQGTLEIVAPIINEKRPILPAPKAITTRANPLIKQIETDPGEISIDLYDNGQIDGDTVSVYDNNQLIVSRARLSTKPISFRVRVDPSEPRHELVMVANNLGSIPPNTSIMVITTKNKRYEVFISSTEQKNAKIVIEQKNRD